VPARDLALEVTETVLLEGSERPRQTLERLKALGVSIVPGPASEIARLVVPAPTRPEPAATRV